METNPRDYGERCRLDAFYKTVLKHEAIDYIREMKRRASRETSLERLPQTAMDKLCSAAPILNGDRVGSAVIRLGSRPLPPSQRSPSFPAHTV